MKVECENVLIKIGMYNNKNKLLRNILIHPYTHLKEWINYHFIDILDFSGSRHLLFNWFSWNTNIHLCICVVCLKLIGIIFVMPETNEWVVSIITTQNNFWLNNSHKIFFEKTIRLIFSMLKELNKKISIQS